MLYKNVFVVVLLALVAMMLSACGSCGEDQIAMSDGTCKTVQKKEIDTKAVEKALDKIVDSPAGKAAGQFIKDGQDGLERQAYQAIDGARQQVGNSVVGQAATALQNSPIGNNPNTGKQGGCGVGFHIGSDGDCAPGQATK